MKPFCTVGDLRIVAPVFPFFLYFIPLKKKVHNHFFFWGGGHIYYCMGLVWDSFLFLETLKQGGETKGSDERQTDDFSASI